MHKKTTIAFIIIIISINFANAQNLFNNRYDLNKGPEVVAGLTTYNNNFYITGVSQDSTWYSALYPNSKIAILKTDINGNEIWKYIYGVNQYLYNYQFKGTPTIVNKQFYFNGIYRDTLNKVHQYLFKYNEQGDSLLLVHYFENDTSVEYWGGSSKATRDSNLVLCGVLDSSSFNNYSQMYIMKVDTLGSVLWTKTYGGSNYEACTNMDTCTDGGFVLGGWTMSYGGSDKDPYIVKTDSNGNFQWDKTINSNSYNDWPAIVISTKDGGILAVTTEVQFEQGSTKYTKLYFNKYNINGNLLWRKSIGDTLRSASIFSVQETENGDFVAVATAQTHNHIMKIDANGDSIFMHEFYRMESYCSWQDQYGFDMALIDNGGYAVAGFIAPTVPGGTPNNSQDAWLTTFDSLGCQLPNKPYNLTASISFTANDTIIDLQWDYNATSIHEQFVVQRYIEWGYVWDVLHMDCITNGLQGYIPIPYNYYTDTLTETLKTKYRIFAIDTVSHLMSCHSNVVSIDLTNAVVEIEQKEVLVKVYPNPAAECITVVYDIEDIGDGVFSIYSMDGKLILEKELKRADKQIRINTAALENGVYFYSLRSKGRFMGNGKIVLIK